MSQLAELLLNTEELKNVRHQMRRRMLPVYIAGGILGSAGIVFLCGSTLTVFEEAVRSTEQAESNYASYNESSPTPTSEEPALIGGIVLLATGLIFAGAERWRFKREDVVACQMLQNVSPVDIPKPRT